jgi:hypothetical protein
MGIKVEGSDFESSIEAAVRGRHQCLHRVPVRVGGRRLAAALRHVGVRAATQLRRRGDDGRVRGLGLVEGRKVAREQVQRPAAGRGVCAWGMNRGVAIRKVITIMMTA